MTQKRRNCRLNSCVRVNVCICVGELGGEIVKIRTTTTDTLHYPKMIPATLQLITSNGIPSAIQKDVLEKFVLPIRTNMSTSVVSELHNQVAQLQSNQTNGDQSDDEMQMESDEGSFTTYFNGVTTNGDDSTKKSTQWSEISDNNHHDYTNAGDDAILFESQDADVENDGKCEQFSLTS